tara:strand:- start:153 stop:497 length:345 start_codon:yes stop_codon:yes gene_type:complete
MVSMANYPNAMVDFQSFTGPGDRGLRSSEVEGYQPVSRIGEVVMNCFVDAYEFTTLKGAISAAEMDGSGNAGDAVEYKCVARPQPLRPSCPQLTLSFPLATGRCSTSGPPCSRG